MSETYVVDYSLNMEMIWQYIKTSYSDHFARISSAHLVCFNGDVFFIN